MHYRGTNENEELPALWRQFWPRHAEIEDRIEPSHAYGVVDNFKPVSKTLDYWAGVAAEKDCRVPEGMVKVYIHEHTYAVFQCTLPTLMESLGKIFGEWLPSSANARTNGPEFELYDERFDIDQEKFDMSVWIPVERK